MLVGHFLAGCQNVQQGRVCVEISHGTFLLCAERRSMHHSTSNIDLQIILCTHAARMPRLSFSFCPNKGLPSLLFILMHKNKGLPS